MGTFQVEVEIGDPQGERWESLSLPVDTGSMYSVAPRPLLESLGVKKLHSATFHLADGRTFDQDIGQTWIRLGGKSVISLVAFGEERDEPLLGAYALEGLLLGVDPVGQRLVPVEALRLRRNVS